MAHQTKAKNVNGFTPEGFKSRMRFISDIQKKVSNKPISELHVGISQGNTKTGILVPSVSLLPILDCGNCKACKGFCYDFRNDLRYTSSVIQRSVNSRLYRTDPERYFDEVSANVKASYCMFFRWHIGGDIVDMPYLLGMVRVAQENPRVEFLAFTKMFGIVNDYLSDNALPSNLHIIFSGWVGMDMPNPYNLPSAHPLFADGRTTAPDGAQYCGGNCSECARNGEGCWKLKNGEAVIFLVH